MSMNRFIDDTLSSNGKKSFYSPVTCSKLNTFTDMKTKTVMLVQGKKKFVRLSAEIVFRRALKIAQVHQDTALLQVIRNPITAVPTSLFHENGTMRKTMKAELSHVLAKQIPECENDQTPQPRPETHVYIRGAMGELHSLPNQCHILGDIARVYMDELLKCFRSI